MARTLVQALEGINFPCDRARIVEYARGNDVSSRALEYLEQLPEQQYSNMTELFSALPAKSSRRPRLNVVSRQQQQPQQPQQRSRREDEAQDNREWSEDQSEPGQEQESRDQDQREGGQAQPEMPFQFPLEGIQAFGQAGFDPIQMACQWQHLWLDWYGKSMQIGLRLMFPWNRD